MLKKQVVAMLIVGVVNLFFASTALAGTNESKNAALVEKVKAGIEKLGTGPDAKVKLKLYDKTKIKGYISEADDDSFVVVEAKTGETTEVPYSSVKQVQGNNMSQGVKILIGLGILVGVLVVIAVLVGRDG